MSATSTTESKQTATLKLGSKDDKAYLKKETMGKLVFTISHKVNMNMLISNQNLKINTKNVNGY